MNYVGIDLHKKTIVLCVMNQDRKVIHRKTFACCQTEAILDFFRELAHSEPSSKRPPATNGWSNCLSRWPKRSSWPTRVSSG